MSDERWSAVDEYLVKQLIGDPPLLECGPPMPRPGFQQLMSRRTSANSFI